MRITFIASSLWLSGGNRVIVEYANRLCQRGHQISILIPKDTVSAELNQELIPAVRVIEAAVSLKKQINAFDKVRLSLSMVRAVPESDVIIATHTPTTVVSLVTCAILRKGVSIWFYQDYPEMFARRPFEGWLLRHAFSWHKAVFVVSSFSEQEISALGAKKTYLVSEGLSNAREFQPRQPGQPLEPDAKKSIFYLGDFRARKGLADFLKAGELVWEQRKDIELWLAIKEPGKVQTSLPFRYFFRPTIAQLASLYASCSVFVSASWSEGFGLPPLEAMSCAAPVVMTDSGGVRDYAKNEENCLLVPVKDPQALADAILRVLNDPQLEAKLRRNGPSTARLFDWDHAVDRFEQALNDNLRSS